LMDARVKPAHDGSKNAAIDMTAFPYRMFK